MKFLLMRFCIAIGFFGFFDQAANHFEAHAEENSSPSKAETCSTIGGRSGGCGKCN